VSSAVACLSVAEDADGSELQEQRVCWACLGLCRSCRLNTCQRNVPGLAAVKPHTPPLHWALQSTHDQSARRKTSRLRVVMLSCGACCRKAIKLARLLLSSEPRTSICVPQLFSTPSYIFTDDFTLQMVCLQLNEN
jgi:hypothetical protein